MKVRTAEEVKSMLEEMSPEQVRAEVGTNLDHAASTILDEAEREDAETQDLLTETSQVFRENLPPVPALGSLPKALKQSGIRNRDKMWFARPLLMSNGLLSMAALVFAAMTGLIGYKLYPKFKKPPIEVVPSNTRSATRDLVGLKDVNKTLYDALIDRGRKILDLSREIEGPEELEKLLKDALQDFAQAADLLPDEPRSYEFQARTYEKLGEPKKAQEVFGKYEEAREKKLKDLL